MNHEEARSILRLTLPTTENALKTAYRRKALEVHPDTCGSNPLAHMRFLALQEAYELLSKDPEVVVTHEGKTATEDGTPLSELGKGLGSTVNGKPCSSCHGKGYESIYDEGHCPDCCLDYGGGFASVVAYRCRKCSGTGQFVHSGRDVGPCFACHGTGWHRSRTHINTCKTCSGRMIISSVEVARHIRCYECAGTGEVKCANPVLPKGLFGTG